MAKETILTKEGFEALKAEINELETTGRRAVAERIKVAREFGDISENSEYDDAKNEQAMLETRIMQLQDKLRSAVIVEIADLESGVVNVGTTVHLKDQKTDKSVKYKIVGITEASPAEGRLSHDSPIGRALMGHKKNEVVVVPVPRGPDRKLKITKIDV